MWCSGLDSSSTLSKPTSWEEFKKTQQSVYLNERCIDFLSCDTDVVQEEVELWVTARVDGGFEQRHEDILQHLLEVSQLLLCAVNVTGRRQNRNFPKYRVRQCLTFLQKLKCTYNSRGT